MLTDHHGLPAEVPFAADEGEKLWPYSLLFFISGIPALLYQIVWQRTLFTIYGVNIQSVTAIVTVFMLGLGLGSLGGGKLSAIRGVRALRAFGMIEASVGIFGSFSLMIFHWVAGFTAGVSIAKVGLIAFALLLIPTFLMGSTLPLLVAHLVRYTKNVGESVGTLYAVNTLGSGVACLLAAEFLMHALGESGSVRVAACLNFLVGIGALVFSAQHRDEMEKGLSDKTVPDEKQRTIPFEIALLLAGVSGFIALAYEILWYHLYSFASGGTAPCFAKLLGFYLFGIALGSMFVCDLCREKLRRDLDRTLRAGAAFAMLGAIAAYLVGPILAHTGVYFSYEVTYPFVSIASALLGALFPLLSHAAIGPEGHAGEKLSYLYLSNIIGSTLGSFLVGFVILDHLSTEQTSALLLIFGTVMAGAFALLARPIPFKPALAGLCLIGLVLAVSPRFMFQQMFERMLWRSSFHRDMRFINLVENRNGVIAVDAQETVYGEGVYDGHFNLDPVHDTNGIFRAYVIPAIHSQPKKVLVIGLSSGSWAQVLVNYPSVEDMTVVEINPGYLPLIRERSTVAGFLRNPKVHIYIDDGRRWLAGHPDSKFDFILNNTTFNWRANASNLLSVEFLQMLRKHLKPGGVAYYNTTWSPEALMTGVTVFPYALRISSCLAVSDSPLTFDRTRLRAALTNYTIDGQRAFDLAKPEDRAQLEHIVMLKDSSQEPPGHAVEAMLEDRASLIGRLKGARLITDDNMGTEWK
jgi:spermidine synthase